MTCGTIETAMATGALAAWAQCWFTLLMMLVIVTVAVLFIIGMVTIVSMK